MARYNTVSSTSTIGSASTINTPNAGLYTQFTGSAPYTAQLPSPVLFAGSQMAFYNNTSPAGIVTLSTVTNGGYIQGPGQPNATTSTYSLVACATLIIFSDGTNFQLISLNGANTFVNNLTAAGTVSLTPANTSVTISPTGTGTVTIAPATAGTINNVTIGGTTAADITANTITVNTSLAGSGTISGGTF